MTVSAHQPNVQSGDLVMRPKNFLGGLFGKHYGTALDGGLVAHTLPGKGKHISTLEEFAEGHPISIKRRSRTATENRLVQQRAVADLGKRYLRAVANCEHDVTTVHDGRSYSPMVDCLTIGLVIGVVAFGFKLIKESVQG